MQNPIEVIRSARQRINPEGLMFSAAVTAASPAVLTSAASGMTFIIHQLAQEVDPNLMKIGTIGVISLLNIASVIAETKALKSHEYSASPVSSSLYILTGRPLISSLVGHLLNYAQISVLNPINVFAIATNNTELLIESEGSASLVLTAWFTTLNTLVLQGKTQPFVDKVRQIREGVQEKFRRR